MSLRERITLAGGILALALAMGMLTVLVFEIVEARNRYHRFAAQHYSDHGGDATTLTTIRKERKATKQELNR